jgi:uncharacterized membrane protein YkvA (DUF1232 family)
MHEPQRGPGWLLIVAVYWALQLIYLVSPIDILPDFLPFVGFADDLVGVLAGMGLTAWTVWRELSGPKALPEPESYRPLTADEIDHLG